MLRVRHTTVLPGLAKSPMAVLQTRYSSAAPSLRHDSGMRNGGGGAEMYQEKTTTPSKTTKAPAFSVVPTSTLLRSLLITTVSGNRMLRVPSLSLLLLFSKAKGWLFSVDRNPLVHWVLRKTLYDHFCAGEKETQVRETIQQLKDTGLRGVILTHARETSRDAHALAAVSEGEVFCELLHAWKEDILKTVDLIGDGDFLAIKLTGAGPIVLEAFRTNKPVPKQMVDAMDEITQRVVQRKARILMDAEQQSFQTGIAELTLNLMRKYNRDGEAVVYNTYQAYLKSTPDTIASHLRLADEEGFTLGLKLVRGAYMGSDPRHLIHDSKSDTDTAYDHIVQSVLRRQFREFGGETGSRPFPPTDLFLATHNKRSAVTAHHLHQSRLQERLPTVKVEYGQLMGMADSVSYGMLQLKSNNNVPPGVFKCLHWGTMGECLGFLVRRAMENQDAVSRTSAEHQALKAELKRRIMN